MKPSIKTELENYLVNFFQDVLDDIQHNVDTMTDSRGYKRKASQLMSRGRTTTDVKGDMTTSTIYMEDYYDYIDKGVRGKKSTYGNTSGSPYKFTRMPNISNIQNWMRLKGIVPRSRSKKNFGKPLNSDKARFNLAKWIAKGIMDKGIEAVPFYSSVVNIEMNKRLLSGIENISGENVEVTIHDNWLNFKGKVEAASDGSIRITIK